MSPEERLQVRAKVKGKAVSSRWLTSWVKKLLDEVDNLENRVEELVRPSRLSRTELEGMRRRAETVGRQWSDSLGPSVISKDVLRLIAALSAVTRERDHAVWERDSLREAKERLSAELAAVRVRSVEERAD
jgi:hypothetical protein